MAQVERLLILKLAELSILVHIKELVRAALRRPLIDHLIELAQTGAFFRQAQWDARRSELMMK